ncbi:MAG: acyl-CoA dehydrogenase family protein [Actinobacteria bacterium]|nr:acyl-CoA dehydrogenase family protein [Actinomycetota bacterium]
MAAAGTDAQVSLLDAHLTEEERALLAECEELATAKLAPLAHAHEESGNGSKLDRELIGAIAEAGLYDRLYARDEDGAWTVKAMELCLIREGLARGSTAAETAFALQGLGSFPLLQSGTEAMIDEWVPRLARGSAVAAFALSEPDAGTDVAALSLKAESVDDGGFILNGEKIWISNAPEADLYTVFARTTAGAGARGITGFAVPRESAGFSGEAIEMLSPHPIGRIVLEDVHVPREAVLGEVDRGMSVAMRTLDLFRPSVGAFAVGMAEAALAAAVEHAADRDAFGGKLKDLQAVSHRLAEVAARIQGARLLVHDAARSFDRGLRPITQVAAMAKLMATEVAQEAVDVAVQTLGARALVRGHLLEHLYRDVRAPRIYEGASEIQREIIARTLFAQGGKS